MPFEATFVERSRKRPIRVYEVVHGEIAHGDRRVKNAMTIPLFHTSNSATIRSFQHFIQFQSSITVADSVSVMT